MDLSGIDVIILCGGLGRRLGALLRDLPKPLIPVGDKTFLEILIERVQSAGFRRFILCTGYRGEKIRGLLAARGKDVIFSHEEEPLGTGGAVRHSKSHIRSRMVLVMNGDSICPTLNYGSVVEFHVRSGASVTIVVSEARGRTDGGVVTLGPGGTVGGFSEKKNIEKDLSYLNTGVYVFDTRAIDEIPGGSYVSLELDFFPSLLPRDFRAFITDSPLYDVGTTERLDDFRRFWESRQGIPCK